MSSPSWAPALSPSRPLGRSPRWHRARADRRDAGIRRPQPRCGGSARPATRRPAGRNTKTSPRLKPSLAVAAAGRLGDLVEPGLGAIDHREVHIDPGLDQRRADDDAAPRRPRVEPLADLLKALAAVPRAHQRREVVTALPAIEPLVELAGMHAGVDDAERLLMVTQACGERPVVEFAQPLDADALERSIKSLRLGRDLAHVAKAALEARRLIVSLDEGWLGRRAQHDARAVVAGEFVERRDARPEQRQRQRLRLVQDHHASRDVVQLAAAGRPVGEQPLEELHGGGDDHGGVPVLHREAQLVLRLGRRLRVVDEGAVVLEHGLVAERLAEDGGVLLDDAGVGDDVDHPFEACARAHARARRRATPRSCRRRSAR